MPRRPHEEDPLTREQRAAEQKARDEKEGQDNVLGASALATLMLLTMPVFANMHTGNGIVFNWWSLLFLFAYPIIGVFLFPICKGLEWAARGSVTQSTRAEKLNWIAVWPFRVIHAVIVYPFQILLRIFI